MRYAKVHGLSKTREYGAWEHIISRCTNKNSHDFCRYGGRGITVCDSWRSFENFYRDMGKRPSSGHSIDRIDNEGNYEPGNCKWSTSKQQGRNKRNNRRLTWQGKTMCVTEWAEKLGIPAQRIYNRVYKGWTDEQALSGKRIRAKSRELFCKWIEIIKDRADQKVEAHDD